MVLRNTWRCTCLVLAPKAIRMPISEVCRATEYEMTP
jgi:hypothetical protein